MTMAGVFLKDGICFYDYWNIRSTVFLHEKFSFDYE